MPTIENNNNVFVFYISNISIKYGHIILLSAKNYYEAKENNKKYESNEYFKTIKKALNGNLSEVKYYNPVPYNDFIAIDSLNLKDFKRLIKLFNDSIEIANNKAVTEKDGLILIKLTLEYLTDKKIKDFIILDDHKKIIFITE